jgi:preprotein translocase subunit YajC
MLLSTAHAQAAGSAAAQGGAMSSVLGLAPLFLVFIVFYFLLVRPQQQRLKAQQAAVAAVKKGDQVVTAGGVVGRVIKVEDQFVEVEIAANTRIRVVKSTLAEVTSGTKPAND